MADLFSNIDITAGRHGGNEESAAAHARIRGVKQHDRDEVLKLIKSSGYAGMTLDQISEELGRPPNAISGRITELLAQGLIQRTKVRRPTRSGCMARVLVARP